jgi:hypothetical protein
MEAMARRYGTAAAFKTALESNLRRLATERAVPLSTLQLKLVIERLLARLFHGSTPPWLLKGGFAMDLRFRPRARTTKDLDLAIALPPARTPPVDFAGELRERIQAAADVDLGDHLTYRIGTPRRELANAPGGGARYPCATVLLGKPYARFHVDVGCGDPLVGEPEQLVGDDLLAFAGIPPATVLAISGAQQFAEKLHAYTFPWSGRSNTRSKDLVDLVLLIERGPPDTDAIRIALSATFAARATHTLPTVLGPPPGSWVIDFPPMAAEAGLSTSDCLEAFAILDGFWRAAALGGLDAQG